MTRSRRRSIIPLGMAATAVVGVVGLTSLQASQAPAATPAPVIDRALIDKYCVSCHNERLKTAGLSLDKIDLTKLGEHAAVLEKVVQKLRSGQMPPGGRPRPDKPDLDRFVTSLETALDRATEPNPGRIAAHRLNRLEYVNVIRDLLALDIDPDLLPADNAGLSFDNNADILSVTPALVNRYMSAASKISRLALGDPTQRPANAIYRVAEFAFQDSRMNEDLPFGTHGGLAVRHTFPLDGQYAIKLRMQRNSIGDTIRGLDDEHEIELRIDRKLVKTFRVGGQYKGYDPGFVNSAPDEDVEGKKLHTYRLTADEGLQIELPVKAGPHLVTAAFTDSAPAVSELVPLVPSSLKRSSFTDDSGEPGIELVSIAGPQQATSAQDTPSRRRIFICQPTGERDAEACARKILSTLAQRAYRRPLNEVDLQELMRLYTAGNKEGGFESGIGLALETLLWSPAFLIRMEHDRAGATAGSVQRLSDLELASRLSFFLWKSMPDDTLLALAAKGRLSDPTVRAQQVARMMADPKASRWMEDFTAQWLTVRNIETQEPDPDLNPEFDDNLREAMARETELFVASQVRDDRSVLDLLNADYTFLNARLARHYKIPNVYGSHFRRVPVTDPARRGLLGHGSILTVTSYANRTSVVLRGKWVLEALLGAPPPPPPANVPPLPENKPGAPPTSLRERMEQHRSNPVCASCHTHMDPLGFVLENFDATGRWRDTESGLAINAVGNASGVTIDGPAGVRDYLMGRGDEVVRTVTRKLLEYALGRSLEYYDAPALRRLVREVEQKDNRWSALILGIVESTPFQMRSAAGEDAAVAAAVSDRR
jgi:hypothetical protein